MKRKVVKTRKKHLCDICGKEIEVGELALYVEDRLPVYGIKDIHDINVKTGAGWIEYEKQSGIEYYKSYQHHDCVDMVTWNRLEGV